jgi:hypothetical protein
MERIGSGALPLSAPTRAQVEQTYQRVREIYCTAHAWEAPEIHGAVEYAGSTRMRQYVRAWVNLWDLRRLYGWEGSLTIEALAPSYEEDADIEQSEAASANPFDDA